MLERILLKQPRKSEGKRQQRMLIEIVSEMKWLLEYSIHYRRVNFLQL